MNMIDIFNAAHLRYKGNDETIEHIKQVVNIFGKSFSSAFNSYVIAKTKDRRRALIDINDTERFIEDMSKSIGKEAINNLASVVNEFNKRNKDIKIRLS